MLGFCDIKTNLSSIPSKPDWIGRFDQKTDEPDLIPVWSGDWTAQGQEPVRIGQTRNEPLRNLDSMILDFKIHTPPLLKNNNSRSIFFANDVCIKCLSVVPLDGDFVERGSRVSH
nr:uncharacterized protein LOC112747967 [Arachis hypogaea]